MQADHGCPYIPMHCLLRGRLVGSGLSVPMAIVKGQLCATARCFVGEGSLRLSQTIVPHLRLPEKGIMGSLPIALTAPQ